MTARLLLTRHGETVWHADNRYCGISDVALTPRGERQAEELASWTAARRPRPDAVACSPVSRAVRTAEPAAAALGLKPEIVEGLREVDFGVAEGRTLAEVAAQDPSVVEAFRRDPVAGAFPDMEPPRGAAARAAAALRELAGRHEGGTVLVVAHNTLLRMALCELLGIPLARYRAVFPRLVNAAVTELDLAAERDGTAALLSLNVPTGGGERR
ncbi:histidine phosphatase family protein [Mangrovactinospora gilvigrisea]|uniref:Histidine phosphatase family protein n=1 Tax=Mangrovactinospora gilvigrisea TaxID=1428644 RepID=A0A1J7C963_9ACTN|nr:histidine phosphatase family protein [Mangrovactinospora gilvigrisea]OIV36178.1 histidine phosphatase family protein [Mangrovactinospora gilvigrisea]